MAVKEKNLFQKNYQKIQETHNDLVKYLNENISKANKYFGESTTTFGLLTNEELK